MTNGQPADLPQGPSASRAMSESAHSSSWEVVSHYEDLTDKPLCQMNII